MKGMEIWRSNSIYREREVVGTKMKDIFNISGYM